MSTPGKAKGHPDELTLKLDGALITPEAFKKAAQSFADLLIHITDEIAQDETKPLWNISVRTGSSVFVARPVATADKLTKQRARQTIKALRSGISRLDHGVIDVPFFNSQALIAARDLSALRAKPGMAGITTIQFGNGDGKVVEVTPKIADVVKKSFSGEHRAFGSIEGKLQTISDRGSFQFVVFDALSDKGVNCFVPQEKFNLAHAAFGKRVRVEGEINYDKQGRPLSIRVTDIKVFKDLKDLPPVEAFLGILASA
ncbi:MAG: hypothetical protein EXS37_05430 [Opitutus sp.]|nr:hypothetical protein [Opitutus sp.]